MTDLVGAAEVAETLIEEVAEAVVLPNVKLIAASAAVAGLVAGIGLGYLVARNRLEAKYTQIAEDEISEMRSHFEKRELARREKPDLADLAAPGKAAIITKNEQYHEESPVDDEKVVVMGPDGSTVIRDVPDYMKNADGSVTRSADLPPVKSHYTEKNVFDTQEPDNLGDGWDYATETKLRAAKSGFPYVIHQDEIGEEPDVGGLTEYTYYEEDDVLADETDKIVHDRETMIGGDNLLRFGQGSGSEDVVFVRNPTLGEEFEITKSQNSYAREVLGIEPEDEDELSHSEIPRRQKRWDDE